MFTRRAMIISGAAMASSSLVVGAAAASVEDSPQSPASAFSQPLSDEGLRALRAASGAPGLAAAAQLRGAATTAWATGLRMAGSAPEVTGRDQWHVGSIGKSFLATLVGRLIDSGRLSWDDTLGKSLTSTLPTIPAPYRDATLLHLLSHRASLVDNLPLSQMRVFDNSKASEAAQRMAYLGSAFAVPPIAPLGTKTLYSNVGYVAAAAIIEARTGRSWENLMRADVFRPLGLTSAGFGPPGRAGELTEPVGHGPFFDQPYKSHPPGQPNADLPVVMAPAGRIHISLPDLVIYLRAHRDRTSFLRPRTWHELHTPHFDGEYALGWNIWPDGTLSHDGSNLLWYAVASFNSKTGLAGAAAANDGRPQVWGYVGEALRRAEAAVQRS